MYYVNFISSPELNVKFISCHDLTAYLFEDLPRNLLTYCVNFISSPQGYLHTVICHSEEFRGTAVGHDLHYIVWDHLPKQHPHTLSTRDFNKMSRVALHLRGSFPVFWTR
jgi:hypothetical protein